MADKKENTKLLHRIKRTSRVFYFGTIEAGIELAGI